MSAQTHSELEIIVVDDGSTDRTAQIAETHGRTDPRLRLIRKVNGGVASARNAGISASSAEFVAFADADDLWHPTKISRQLARLIASGTETALVYAPFRQIDMQGRVFGSSRNHRVEGWVANRHFYVNIIGNGSSILIRKAVLEEMGGFSPILQDNAAQGCEDFLLQLRTALRYRFATVPEYLVGYRQSPGNMSSNEERMLRSSLLAFSLVLAESPDIRELAGRGLLGETIWTYLKLSAMQRRFPAGWRFLRPELRGRRLWVLKAACDDGVIKLRRLRHKAITLAARRGLAKSPIAYRHFYAYDPADMNYADHLPMTAKQEAADEVHRRLAALAPFDAAYRPEKYLANNGENLAAYHARKRLLGAEEKPFDAML